MRNYMAELGAREAQTSDTIVHVDRATACPIYPSWAWAVLHPGLQRTGPAEYDLRTVVKWRHDEQKKKAPRIYGKGVYKYLKENDMLESCLGIVDGLEIQKKGVAVFHEIFGDNMVLLSRSPILNESLVMFIPYLLGISCKERKKVMMGWHCTEGFWHGHYYTPRFR